MSELTYVGSSVERKDAVEKVTGSAQFIEDRFLGPLLYCKMKKVALLTAASRSLISAKL